VLHFESALMRTGSTEVYCFFLFVSPHGMRMSEKQFRIHRGLNGTANSRGPMYGNVETQDKQLRVYYKKFHEEGRLI